MAMSKSRRRVKGVAGGSCGKCYWLWKGKPKSSKGLWLPLECDCTLGCIPSIPPRPGIRKYEVVTTMCRPLRLPAGSPGKGVVVGDIPPDCPGGFADCEYEAQMQGGSLRWVLISQPCEERFQTCQCLGPDWDPDYLGERAFGRCISTG